jgi:hypothetical protein
MLLHGPFVGGAYVYIDPTPSKNVFKVNINVIPRNMGTIPAAGMRACHAAHAGAMGPAPMPMRGGAWGDGMNACPAPGAMA